MKAEDARRPKRRKKEIQNGNNSHDNPGFEDAIENVPIPDGEYNDQVNILELEC